VIDEQTYKKLNDLKLSEMAEAFVELLKEAPSHERSFPLCQQV